MTHGELDIELQKGLDDFEAGRVFSAAEVRAEFQKAFDV